MSIKLFPSILKVYLKSQSPSSHITKSLSLLEEQHEEYGQGVTDHILSLKLGLQFIGTILNVSVNEHLKMRIESVIYEMTLELHLLSNCLDLDCAYTDLRKKMKNVMIIPSSTRKYELILGWNIDSAMGYEFLSRLIEYISHCTSHVNAAPLMKEIEDIKENLMLLQPLLKFVTSIEVRNRTRSEEHLIRLAAFIDKAACLVYSCLVDKMDGETTLAIKFKLADVLENVNFKEIYINVLMASEIKNRRKIEFYLLHNLIKLLDLHATIHLNLNDPSEKLHDKLISLKLFSRNCHVN